MKHSQTNIRIEGGVILNKIKSLFNNIKKYNNKTKLYVLLFSIILICFFVILIGQSYAIFSGTTIDSNEQIVKLGNLEVVLNEPSS